VRRLRVGDFLFMRFPSSSSDTRDHDGFAKHAKYVLWSKSNTIYHRRGLIDNGLCFLVFDVRGYRWPVVSVMVEPSEHVQGYMSKLQW